MVWVLQEETNIDARTEPGEVTVAEGARSSRLVATELCRQDHTREVTGVEGQINCSFESRPCDHTMQASRLHRSLEPEVRQVKPEHIHTYDEDPPITPETWTP